MNGEVAHVRERTTGKGEYQAVLTMRGHTGHYYDGRYKSRERLLKAIRSHKPSISKPSTSGGEGA